MVFMFKTLIFKSHGPNVHQSSRNPGHKFLLSIPIDFQDVRSSKSYTNQPDSVVVQSQNKRVQNLDRQN